jgi:hypothetical protein
LAAATVTAVFTQFLACFAQFLALLADVAAVTATAGILKVPALFTDFLPVTPDFLT